MDLLAALGHAEPPRAQYYLNLPTRYGQLRVDILSPDPEAARMDGLTDGAAQAHALVEAALARVQRGDPAGAEAMLLDAVRRYPYSHEAFGALSDVCTSLGRTADAVYYGRQVIGLVPSYRNLTLLARALGQDGRLEEAATVQRHLWQSRAEAEPAEALEAVQGYLVTLSRLDDARQMAQVCGQALAEHPGDPTLQYQQAFAALLLGRQAEAYRLVEEALIQLPASEPLVPRFRQLRDGVAAQLAGLQGGPAAGGTVGDATAPVGSVLDGPGANGQPAGGAATGDPAAAGDLVSGGSAAVGAVSGAAATGAATGAAGQRGSGHGVGAGDGASGAETAPETPQAATPDPGFGLPEVVAAIEAGHLPPQDGGVTIVPGEGRSAVLAFTAHSVVAADVDPDWIRARLPPGDLSAPLNPPFLTALASRLGGRVNSIDIVVIAPRLIGRPPVPLSEVEASRHPRVQRALLYREDVHVWVTEGGLLVLGRGVGGRWEVSVEIEPAHRNRGLGRALAIAGRHLVPGTTLWAQVAPGNAASARAFLAAGFTPVGAEALIVD